VYSAVPGETHTYPIESEQKFQDGGGGRGGEVKSKIFSKESMELNRNFQKGEEVQQVKNIPWEGMVHIF